MKHEYEYKYEKLKTMRTKTYLFALMTMALTLGSCSDNESGIGGEASKYITVSTTIGNMTRVATDENGGQKFVEGDEISVYAWTGDAIVAPETSERVVNNAINKLTNGSWVSTPQMLWKNNRDKHYFIGVYPTAAISDLTAGEYTLDVTKQEASDLLVAVNTDGISYNADEQQTVPLTFTHVMSKLIVNLQYRNQFGGTPTVKSLVIQNAVSDASVNFLTKTVTIATDAARADQSLLATKANEKYESIVIPQNGISKIVITIGDKQYIYTHPSDIKLESGKCTVVNLIVGRDEIILGDVSIDEWGEGDNISGGEAQVD